MIPKVIHYVWLGGNTMPKILKKCIKSWKKYCPDYEIKRWDESNLDLNKYQFAKDAYDAKKWAYASDVFRYDILNREGGIYLDTDVELLKPINHLLKYDFFSGFETNEFIAPGLILGSKKNSAICSGILKIYETTKFNINDLGMQTVGVFTTNYLEKEFGLKRTGETQFFEEGKIALFSSDYFCPRLYDDKKNTNFTENTVSIHHYAASWVKKPPLIKRIYWKIKDVGFRLFKKKL